MQQTLRGVGLGCLLLVASCSSGPKPGAASKEEFEQRFVDAVKSRNVDALLSLYCWDGVDDEMKTYLIDSMVRRFILLDVVDARYVASKGKERPTIKIKGREYQASLDVTGVLEVQLKDEMAATMPVGQKHGRWFFAVMASRPE